MSGWQILGAAMLLLLAIGWLAYGFKLLGWRDMAKVLGFVFGLFAFVSVAMGLFEGWLP